MKDLQKTTAVILAGGLGTRLRSVVSDKPKVLADIKGHPFLTYLLDYLISFGVKKTVLCAGFLSDQLITKFGSRYKSMEIIYSVEEQLLGTGGALRLAHPLMDTDPVLILNGDSFYEVDLEKFLKWHKVKKASASLLVNKVEDTARYGRVSLNKRSEIVTFLEKGVEGSGLINAGIYLISPSLIKAIPEKKVVSLEKDIFPKWIGDSFFGYQTRGRFIDIGTPESYKDAQRSFIIST